MQGCAQARCRLGYLYLNGSGVTKDIEEAKKWYEMAAEQKHAEAEYYLAYLYETEVTDMDKEADPKDSEKVLEYYKRAAEHGYAPAQVIIGKRYLESDDISTVIEEAKKWILKAAEQENAEAEYLLAKMYEDGTGFDKDDIKAAQYYRLSAEHGYGEAQCWLGDAYYDGNSTVKKNITEAVKWYRKAAEHGITKAQRRIGSMYAMGDGVEKDLAEGIKWTRLAAQKGDMYAQYNMGVMYINGTGVEENIDEAEKWFLKSAKQGFAKAQYNLGCIYELKRNYSEMEKWLKKAGEQGFEDAHTVLINYYINNLSKLSMNPMEIYQYVKKAGSSYENEKRKLLDKLAAGRSLEDLVWLKRISDEENDLYASKCLGDMYFNGTGTEKNYQEAYRYYKKAAQGGLEGFDFGKILGKVNEAITTEMTYKEAMKLLETSSFRTAIETLKELAKKDHAGAQFTLGKLYMEGYRLPKDCEAAYYMLNKARKNGHPEADAYIKNNKDLSRIDKGSFY